MQQETTDTASKYKSVTDVTIFESIIWVHHCLP